MNDDVFEECVRCLQLACRSLELIADGKVRPLPADLEAARRGLEALGMLRIARKEGGLGEGENFARVLASVARALNTTPGALRCAIQEEINCAS